MDRFGSPIWAPAPESATVAQVLVAAAFVPSAPVLVPELSGSGAVEILPVRDAALAVTRELGARARRWMVVGLGDPGEPVAARGSFVGFGVEIEVDIEAGATGPADPYMPTSVLLAGWLAGHSDPAPQLGVALIDAETSGAVCGELGRELGTWLAQIEEPVGLLVVADGATTLGDKSPGGDVPDAKGIQEAIDAALGSGDLPALTALDESECARAGVAGRAVWQLVCGAVAGAEVKAELLCAEAPFGVGYTVARWDLRW